MNRGRRVLYSFFRSTIRCYQRLFLDLRVSGLERIPRGPKIYVQNHIASTDPYWVLPLLPDPVHVIVGPGYQSRLGGVVLDYMEQINAMPEHRATVVDKAVEYLRRGESVYTAPEGDLQPLFQLGRFYPGVAKMYRRFPTPIIPIALHAPPRALRACPWLDMNVDGRVYRSVNVLRGPFFVTIGEPFLPDLDLRADQRADDERIMTALRDRIAEIIDEIRRSPACS